MQRAWRDDSPPGDGKREPRHGPQFGLPEMTIRAKQSGNSNAE
jgi:hypothetical protein